MIHAIYIYFIINAFIAGNLYGSDRSWKVVTIALIFGSLYPLLYLISIAGWLYHITEIRSIYRLYFTDYFVSKGSEGKERLLSAYSSQNCYRKWIIRRIARKYGWSSTY